MIHQGNRFYFDKALFLLIVSHTLSAFASDPSSKAVHSDFVRQVLTDSCFKGGLIVHVGCGQGHLTTALGTVDRCIVQGLDTDPAVVQEARKRILGKGCYGKVSIRSFDGRRLPYADNLVNLLVGSRLGRISLEEVTRILVPNGKAYIRVNGQWKWIKKPRPAEMGDWSHHLHKADGNPVTTDRLVGPPQQLQWKAGPKWQRAHDTDANINALVSAGGRVFYLVDEAPIGLPGANGLPDKWSLAARDGFNGLLLWKVPIKRWGWREYKDTHYRTRHDIIPINIHRRVVATDEVVYATLGFGEPVSQLDATTGKVLHEYRGTTGTREILYDNGQLILTVPGKHGLKPVMLNADNGTVVWTTETEFGGSSLETGRLKVEKQPVLNSAVGEDSVLLLDGLDIVCLERGTGTLSWRRKQETRNPQLRVGTLLVHSGVVLFAEQGILRALSERDGKELWTHKERLPGGLWFSWKDVFVIDHLVWTWGPMEKRLVTEAHAFDLNTGELKKRVDLGHIFKVDHHHRCYRNKATPRFLIASRRGAEFIDLEGGPHCVNNWVRGICHLGMMPANGLLYAPPEPCKCYWYERISDFCALAPAGSSRSVPKQNKPGRAVPGPAFGNAHGPSAEPEDWPEFRGNAARTGSTQHHLLPNLSPTWKTSLSGPLSAPVAVGRTVFVASVDSHTAYALDAVTGDVLWSFTAGGRVDSPPTYANGKLVFGTTDGQVTCLRASDGVPVWQFQALERERLIGVYDQLESAWPIHGSVLVHKGTVYFAAGRSSYLDGGIHLFGLDLNTGQMCCHTHLEGPDVDLSNEAWFDGYNDSGGRGALSDILQVCDDLICMRNRAFDDTLHSSQQPAPAHLQPMGGYLDDTYFKRYFWYYGQSMDRPLYAAMAKPTITEDQMAIALGQILVRDDHALYGMRMFDSMKLLNANNYFVPAKDGYLIFKVPPGKGQPVWTTRVPIRVTAMALTPDRLIIAGPPDVLDPGIPLAAFEGRKGARLRLISTANGETLGEHTFSAPPVFNGLAVARGRVFISLKDGTLVCLAQTSAHVDHST